MRSREDRKGKERRGVKRRIEERRGEEKTHSVFAFYFFLDFNTLLGEIS